jgi:type IV pilus assembly protein PilY1
MSTAESKLKAAFGLCAAILLLAATPAGAAITLSDNPLFLSVPVPPNIAVTLDDSGSMRRAFVPENCLADTSDCDHLDNRYEKSARRNLIHYNPLVTYPAPKNADGSSRTTSFTSAYRNGFDTGFGTVNLSNGYKPTAYLDLNGSATEAYMGHYASDFRCSTVCQYKDESGSWVNTSTACASNNFCRGTHGSGFNPAPMPAYYYVFDSGNASCDGTATDNDCYDIKIVDATSGADRDGDGTISAAEADERENFANWYSFARTRNLATVTATSLAFAGLDPSVRVAWEAVNSCRGSTSSLVTTDCDGWKDNLSASNAIGPFAGSKKNNFYSWLFRLPTNGGTPLPQAMQRVGEYYKTTGENSPYDKDFTTSGSGELACHRNYHILMTDGMWTTGVTAGNADGTTTDLPEDTLTPDDSDPNITTYTPDHPYTDSYSDTLADVAFKYWITDLTGLTNNLTPTYRDRSGTATEDYWNPRNDPAQWQHMVNFTIGLGLTGYLANAGLTWDGDMYGGSYPSILAGTTPWPDAHADASGTTPGNASDLWHAAIDSRGQFFSADDPGSLSGAFRSALTAITDTAGSAAALSSNSTSIQPGNSVVYQAKFDPKDWSGTLLAVPVGTGGTIGTPLWDASQLIPSHVTREIFTHDGTAGAAFSDCTNLSASQQTALGTGGVSCPDRLSWLRGDATKEQRNGGTLRNRTATVMGDIINSDPAYAKNVDYGYAELPGSTPGQSTYASFVAGNSSRTPMVYVGANDGMAHAINADTGVESFAYVPAGVYGNLSLLTNPAYTHHYYVDGAITVGDAYLSSTWKTVLVAGLNAGGRTVYALDITNPTGFSPSHVMWEFNDDLADTDMGYSYSQPQIGILESGDWVAIFGNGYNSAGGGAYLYVVDLATGTLIKKITARDLAGDESNGLSTPVLYDADDDKLVDTVYAGDLKGNLWKFDLSDVDSNNWGVAYSAPLFTARNGSGQVQPITAQPKVTPHPTQPTGDLVVFGTGRYLTAGDVADTTVQTYYGIWDNGGAIATTDRSELQEQTINVQTGAFGFDVRSTTSNSVDWATEKGWHLDLVDPPNPPGTQLGERVVSTSLIKFGRAIFVTVVPSDDPCVPGGYSWLMEIDIVTGGAPADSVFDLSNDNQFSAADEVSGQVATGVRSTVGIVKTPVWLDEDRGKAWKVMTGTGGAGGLFMSVKNKGGGGALQRVYWMQIQ